MPRPKVWRPTSRPVIVVLKDSQVRVAERCGIHRKRDRVFTLIYRDTDTENYNLIFSCLKLAT